MALVGNQSRVNFGSGRSWGGLYSCTAGSRRERGEVAAINWQDMATAALKYAAQPVGYIGGSAYYQAQQAGGISSFNIAQVEGLVGNLNLAGGINLSGTTSVAFNLNAAALILVVDISGAVTCIATGAGAIKGLFDLIGSSTTTLSSSGLQVIGIASVVGDTTLYFDASTLNLVGIAGIIGSTAASFLLDSLVLSGVAGMTGDSSALFDPTSALIKGIAEVSGEVTAVFSISAELAAALAAGGAASFTFSTNTSEIIGYGGLLGDLQANFDLSGAVIEGRPIAGIASCSITENALLLAKAWADGNVSLQTSVTATPYATGELSGNITPGGEATLTADAIAESVWSMSMNQSYSATDIMNLLAAVAAGKTSITDNGDGSFAVVFRDVTDTSDAITATTAGRERSEVAISV